MIDMLVTYLISLFNVSLGSSMTSMYFTSVEKDSHVIGGTGESAVFFCPRKQKCHNLNDWQDCFIVLNQGVLIFSVQS